MTTPRRRVLRPPRVSAQVQRDQRQLEKRRLKLQNERVALDHWMARLRRAFNAIEKHRRRATRLERQLAQLEQR